MSRKALGRGLSALFPDNDTAEENLLEVQLDLLDPSERQPRTSFDAIRLEELATSIRSRGIIQPLVVRRKGDRFEIVAGERRWRAAQRAGLLRVPCLVKDIPEESVLEISLIENIQRQELNAIEEAGAYRRLVEDLGLTQDEIAKRVGKDRTSITNSLRLLKLPAEIQKLVEEQTLTMGHARALLSVGQVERQKTLAKVIVARSLSVRQIEQLVKRSESTNGRSAKPPTRVSGERANIAAAEAKLARRLGAPVRIRPGQKGGVIEIKYSSGDDLTRLFDVLIRTASK